MSFDLCRWPVLALALLVLPTAGRADPGPDLARELAASRLDFDRAVTVHGIQLGVGPALLALDDGLLVPATPVGGKTAEMVFLGRGRFEMDPPDEIEAGQLELSTGVRRLDEEVTEAVFVVGLETTVQALLRLPKATPDAERARRCGQIWSSWRQAPERRLLDVDTAVLSIALGLPSSRSFFAARLRSEGLGEFVYAIDPNAQEQVIVGRRTVLAASELAELNRQETFARQDGFDPNDPVQLERWISAPLRTEDGKAMPGRADFEPQKYQLNLSLAENLEASGLARIELISSAQGARLVKLRLAADLQVSKVTDPAGRELFFTRDRERLAVVLAEPAEAEKTVSLAIEYGGHALTDPLLWFPHAGTFDQALYDVTLRWPKTLDLMAGGERVAGGEAEGARWEQRALGTPAPNFAFEIGRYQIEKARAGHVRITFAFAPRMERERRDEITATVVDALGFFESSFGPYPLDELTVVTGPREVSQTPALGLMILSSTMTGDLDLLDLLFQKKDRRLAIARELSYQWWGHATVWASPREHWLSEGLASYAAAQYAGGLDLTSGWRTVLTAPQPNGRMISTLGPVVLGRRLAVNQSAAVYRAIVLKKGAVVLDMLARLIGQRLFFKSLRVIASPARQVSTEYFLMLLRAFTPAEDLQSFEEEFIDGTVLPEVLLSYQIKKEGETWSVKIRATQQIPYRYHSKIVPIDRGRFDVVREAEEEIPVRSSVFVVPFEFEPPHLWIKGDTGVRHQDHLGLLLRGAAVQYTLHTTPEPQRLWINRNDQVLGFFYEEDQNPRRALFYKGLQAEAAGQRSATEPLYEQALALPESAQDVDTARIETARARLLLDLGEDEKAAEALDRARRSSRDAETLAVLQARLDVRLGRYLEAFQSLSPIRFPAGSPNTPEAGALLAISAHALGRKEDFAKALRKARRLGVDVEALAGAL
jgi:hypothetical protein